MAVYKAVLRTTGISLGIKWVNDLYYNEKKVCGILTEAVTDFESGDIDFAVVGIGLNLYEAEGGYPSEIRNVAGACMRTGKRQQNWIAAVLPLRSSMPFWKRQESCVYLRNISAESCPGREIQIVDGQISVRRRHWRSVRTEGSKYRSLTALCLF